MSRAGGMRRTRKPIPSASMMPVTASERLARETAAPTLPDGWTTKTSRSTGKVYYAHSSGKKQWKVPVAGGTRRGPSHPTNASPSKTRTVNHAVEQLKPGDRIDVNRYGKWYPAYYYGKHSPGYFSVIYDDYIRFPEEKAKIEYVRRHQVARRLAANSQVMEQTPSDTPTFSNQACETPHRPRRRLVELAYCAFIGLNVFLMCCLAIGVCFVCRQSHSKRHRPQQPIRW